MGQAKTSNSVPPPEMKAVDRHVPLGLTLTVQRLSLAEALKAERAQVEAARLEVERAVAGLGESAKT
jgi:hypothetical protein